MKTLLILSKNTSHIALIDNSSNESLLDALNAYINDNEENALMSYMLEQMGEKAFFTESSQKPSFIDLIEENDIQFILTYFKDIKRVSFNIKSNDIFFSFDLKDYVNQYSFENFCNLIKEQENARTSFGFTNEEDNEENRRGERQEIQRGTQGRGENRLFGESNAEDRNADEPRGVGEERGISKSSTGIRRFDRVAGETEGYDRGDEQRRGLGEEKLSLQRVEESISLQSFKQEDKLEDKIAILTHNQSNIANAKRVRDLL